MQTLLFISALCVLLFTFFSAVSFVKRKKLLGVILIILAILTLRFYYGLSYVDGFVDGYIISTPAVNNDYHTVPFYQIEVEEPVTLHEI